MKRTITFFLLLSAWTFSSSAKGGDKQPTAAASSSSPVRIAVVDTFFRDIPEPLVRPLVEPLRVLMLAQTGMDGDVVLPKGALQLAQDLADDKIQIALFHGFEYAWAKHQHAELRPLMIALHQERELQVFLMVRADSPVRSFAELQGKPVALPCFCQEHCWIYMERACQAAGQADPKKFFSSLTTPRDPEQGLDELADGKDQAAIPPHDPAQVVARPAAGVQKSETFPSAVIAYRAGSFDEATIKRLQESLLDGQKTSLGRQLLMLWKLKSLESVPADFDEALNKILKAYPPPERQQAGKGKLADVQTAKRRP